MTKAKKNVAGEKKHTCPACGADLKVSAPKCQLAHDPQIGG